MKLAAWLGAIFIQIFIVKWNGLHWLIGLAEWVHGQCLHFINTSPSRWNWYYAAILIGQSDGIRQRPETAAFVALGFFHLLIVSGAQVRGIEAFVTRSLGFFVKKPFRDGLVALLLIFLTLANRLDPACFRAVCSWGLRFLPKKWRSRCSLDFQFVVSCVCLLIQPKWAQSLSFQLSCAASLALSMAATFSKKGEPLFNRLLRSFFCTVSMAPLMFAVQPCVSWITIPANTVALPVFEAVLVPVSLLSTLIPWVTHFTDPVVEFAFSSATWASQFATPYFCLEERSLKSWGFVYLAFLYFFWRWLLPYLCRREFWTAQFPRGAKSCSGTSARVTLSL